MSKVIPEKVTKFNIYDSGNQILGLAEEATLPDIEHMTSTLSGPGVMGEIESPTPGMISSMTMELTFNAYNKRLFDLQNPARTVDLTIRGALQMTKSTGDITHVGMRIVVRGRGKSFTGGSAKQGEAMGASATIELSYYMVEIDGETVIEIDKLNDVFKINGEDILADIKALC
jgi:hypothetical protein